MSGYEIRRAITEVLGHFWHESFGQIYPTLAALAAEGLITARPGDRAGSTEYSITELGLAALRADLATPPVTTPPRNGVLLRTFFGPHLDPAEFAGMLDAVDAQAAARLATFAQIRSDLEAGNEHAEHIPYWLATVRAGELNALAQREWVRETRALVRPPATLPSP